MSKGWHITRDAQCLTLSRLPTARFDLSAQATFPALRMLPLAQMIRQDMWRLLQNLRGFAPAVRVERNDNGLLVTAGGAVTSRFPKARTEAQLDGLLHDSALRDRWQRSARLTQRKDVL